MDDSQILLSNFEMLKALYDFKATFAKTLSFRENDFFILHQTNTKQRNWWQVINEKGEIGFVPSNYVEKITVAPTFLLQFLDDCITNLQNEKTTNVGLDRPDLLLRLREKRRNTEISMKGMNNVSNTNTSVASNEETVHTKEIRSTTSFSTTSTDSDRTLPDLKYGSNISNAVDDESIRSIYKQKSENSDNNHEAKVAQKADDDNIKPQSVYELVETVRINTKLSHEMSLVAVTSVISHLQEMLPPAVLPHLSKILSLSQTKLTAEENVIDSTHDASRLRVIFKELTYCKEDSQQRSWMLYEDETVITEYISEMISILSNADPSISRHVIADEQYHVVFTLIQYYQMEARWSIRQLLLQAFGVMCSLDATVVSIMLSSVLPMELARDMRANPRNISKLNYSCLLLTMIFSMGEQMPITHLEQLGHDFLTFILTAIESPPDTDIDEQIPDLFLNFVLAFNLQFTNLQENVVLRALAEQIVAKGFTEKILLLLNREEDPVRIFDHEPGPPHSLLKLFIDVFGKEATANLFYTNDTKVLIDIVVRQLSDLSAGDKKRKQYLELCRRVMGNTNYAEHRHRYEDIHKCFTRIFCEESDQSRQDQQLVRDITNEFPHFFKM